MISGVEKNMKEMDLMLLRKWKERWEACSRKPSKHKNISMRMGLYALVEERMGNEGCSRKANAAVATLSF